jgi:phytoene dehydrogenase-like protein
MATRDVVVVGAGPNGLTAAALLARAGLSVLVVEANDTPGGGCRSAALTLPGFLHDTCSAVHPLGAASPVFRELELARHGLEFVHPDAPLAHVLGDGSAVLLERSLEATAAALGPDGPRYRRMLSPFVERWDELLPMLLAPLRVPSSPVLMGRFGLLALRSMRGLASDRFSETSTRALLAGIAAHAMLRLDSAATASFALVLAIAGHAVGWPVARGGSQSIVHALLAALHEHGGAVELDHRVADLRELPEARAYVLDLTPRQVVAVARAKLPDGYVRRLERYRYGPGVYKVDWALAAPIPWRDPACARAATVHLAGSFADVAAAEAAVHDGKVAERPFVLLAQPSLFDRGRAPEGHHTAWAYCHVPHGSPIDALAVIEGQVERHAPGFRERILARSTRNAVEMEQHNPNYIGGDINGGMSDLGQLFTRPIAKLDPYATPAPDVFLCSSSTPPGGGVHGICGAFAAKSVLAKLR